MCCILIQILLSELTQINIPKITFLIYDIEPGAALSGSLSNDQMIAPVYGREVTVSVAKEMVMIDGATVTTADIQEGNGVMHVIDAVRIQKK